jgi:serine protein kinase
VTLLKRGFEKYSKTDEGAVYAIKGCPMHEDPLHLIPHELRDEFFEEYGVRIEGSLSPLNTMRLEKEYSGRLEDVMVERIFFSEDKRVGLGHIVSIQISGYCRFNRVLIFNNCRIRERSTCLPI